MFLIDINDVMNFSPYLELKKINSDILLNGIIRDREQIDEELNTIKKCIYDNQDKLGAEGETNIFEYNRKHSSEQLKSNVVVIGGYPYGFNKNQISILRNLIRKGKDNGVFFVVINDTYTYVDGNSETYFVIETKGTSNIGDLKGFEQDKIACGEKHFELVEDLDYDVCVDYDEFAHNHIHEN